MKQTTTIQVEQDVHEHWKKNGRTPPLGKFLTDCYREKIMALPPEEYKCRCCGQEIAQLSFNDPYVSKEALSQRYNYCWKCLTLNHPRLMGGTNSVIPELCVICGNKT